MYNRKEFLAQHGDFMGIRFYCPNGHKLNVKEFQAGRTGICPFCGSKMQIPLESTRPSSKEERLQQRGEAAAPDAAKTISAAASQKLPAVAANAAPVSTTAPTTNPLTEGVDSVWYVRPSSGGQFGPAASDVMRTWMTEGRIAADSLVWREGWRDWQVAADVFPQLAQGPMIPGMEIVLSEPATPTIHAMPVKHRASARGTQFAVIGFLVFAVIILFAILWMVLKS